MEYNKNMIRSKFNTIFIVFLLLTSALIAAPPKKDVKKEDSKPKSSEIQQERDTILQLSPNQIWKVWKDV